MGNKIIETSIKGVELLRLEILQASGGQVMKMLEKGNPLVPDFPGGIGEIYFSEVLPKAVKAWKMHQKQTQRLAVPMGEIKVALYDMRAASPSLQVIEVLGLGRPDTYNLLIIPPGVWYGFQSMNNAPALICNCPDLPHDPAECETAPWDSPNIPFKWDV